MSLHNRTGHDWSALQFVLCDLDGVVWLARRPIPGAVEAVATLRASGRRVLFVTNNSVPPVAEHEAALAAIGIPADGDVITSAQAVATLVHPGERVLVLGGPGVVEAVRARDAHALTVDEIPGGDAAGPVDLDAQASGENDAQIDVVVAALDRRFDYRRLALAQRAVLAGARLVATNTDTRFPTPHGPRPGAGTIVAAVATATGVTPAIAGKPHAPMAELARQRCGQDLTGPTALVVGDQWATDGRFARQLGCHFALVRSGVTPPGAPIGHDDDRDTRDHDDGHHPDSDRDRRGGATREVVLDVADLAAVAARITDIELRP